MKPYSLFGLNVSNISTKVILLQLLRKYDQMIDTCNFLKRQHPLHGQDYEIQTSLGGDYIYKLQ